MNAINAILNAIADLIFAPMQHWPAWIPLVLISIVCGIAMAYMFRVTTNQQKLRRIAERTKAELLGIKLFGESFSETMRAQGRIMKLIGMRLLYSTPPILVLTIPIVLILIQLAQRYEHLPLVAGESFVMVVFADSESTIFRESDGIVQETLRVYDEVERSVAQRFGVAVDSGPQFFQNESSELVKSVAVAERKGTLERVNPRRAGQKFVDRLLFPGESGFSADDPIRAVEIQYPHRRTPIFGFNVPWWLTFFLVSMAAAWLSRSWLKVQF